MTLFLSGAYNASSTLNMWSDRKRTQKERRSHDDK